VLLTAPLLGIQEAKACSCIPSDPRDDLHASDGAFIGTYVGREPVNPADPYGEYDYIFDTETVFKGEVEDVVRVRAAANGATCGLEYSEGTTGGLFLERDDGFWRSNLCKTERPDRLRDAAQPFARPNAKGPPRLLLGGSFGEVRVIALDTHGDIAGYGYGDGDALLMSLCPGGETSTEVLGTPYALAAASVDVRRVSDLSVQRTIAGPSRWKDAPILPFSARCIGAEGDTAVFARGFDDDGEFSEIVLFAGDDVATVDRGDLSSAAFGRDLLYASDGRAIVAMAYDGRGRRTVATMDEDVSHLALSPDERLLAGLTGAATGDDTPTEMFVMRTEDGQVRARRELGGNPPRALEWAGSRRLLLPRNPAGQVVDRDLEKLGKVSGWFPVSSVALGCRLFGPGYGAVARASVCDPGSALIIREFFSPITYSMVKLPRGTEVDAPPRD
jgi:hypothetical protein